MRKTSVCPKCEQPITLIEAPEASLVECPLCAAQFELSEAMASVRESEEGGSPPLLIIIERRGEQDLGAFFASLALDDASDDNSSADELPEEKAVEEEASERDEDLDSFFASFVIAEPTEGESSDADASEEEAVEEEAAEEEAAEEEAAEEEAAEEEAAEEEAAEEEAAEEEAAEEEAAEEEAVEEEAVEEEAVEEEAVEEEAAEEEAAEEEAAEEEAAEEEAAEEEAAEELEFDEPEFVEGMSSSDAVEEVEEVEDEEVDEEAPSDTAEEETATEGPSEEDVSSEEPSDDEESDDLTLAEEPPIQVRCPCCLESFDLEHLLLAETNKALGEEAASAILADGTVKESPGSTEDMRFNFGAMAAADNGHSGFRLDSVAERPSDTSGAFEFAAPVGAVTDGTDSPQAARAKRRRRERGGLREVWEAILGGAAGLLITYYCLNLFGGPRFDWFKVYLPFVKHTAVHRPVWLGGPPLEEFDSGISEGLGVEEESPRQPAQPPKPSNEMKKQVTPPAEEQSEEPPPKPAKTEAEPVASEYVGPLDTPDVSSDKLGEVLREVDQLTKDGPLTEEAYELWCRIAELATFLDPQDGIPQTQNRLDAMRRLMKGLSLADVREIGRYATRRAVSPDRANHGILLAGVAREPNTPSGKGFLTGFHTAETGAQFTLASDHKLPIQPDDRLLVLGYVVDNPKETTEGLDTKHPQIIWVRTVVSFKGSGK